MPEGGRGRLTGPWAVFDKSVSGRRFRGGPTHGLKKALGGLVTGVRIGIECTTIVLCDGKACARDGHNT